MLVLIFSATWFIAFMLLSKTSIFAADVTHSQELTRTTSGTIINELITVKDGNLYLTIHDGSDLNGDRLEGLSRLRGLKIERLGLTERMPGTYWLGGIGESPRLSKLSNALLVLDLSLPTSNGTFKLNNEGSAFLRSLVNLRELDLSNHCITTGASNLSGLVQLERLSLYNNEIGDSIKDLKSLVNMRVLNLGNNVNMPLDLLKETLLAMTKLEEVDLSFLPDLREETFNEWFADQITAGIRARVPQLRISPAICPVFEEDNYSISLDCIITAEDFLKELNAHLRNEDFPPLRVLSRAECTKPGCLIKVLSPKGNGEAIYRQVYDPDGILMQGGVFSPSDHNHLSDERNGTRKVGFYSDKGQRVLCIKADPEAPGLERATRILSETLFGSTDTSVPNSQTLIMNSRVFTATTYVDGIPFETVIRDIEAQVKPHKVEERGAEFIVNLHRMKVLAILVSPEDGRLQNFLLQLISRVDGNTVYSIASIDNERGFGEAAPHPSRRDPTIIVRGHSAMHCFRESHPNYRELMRVLFAHTPREIYARWLRKVREEDAYQRAIAPFVKIGVDTRLGVLITERIARKVFIKLKHIYVGLRAGDTLDEIFARVDLPLAQVYRAQSTDTPVTPPGTIGPMSDSTPPRSSLAKAAKRIREVDGGRNGKHTPPSACCDLHGDYLPLQGVTGDIAAIMWGPESPTSIITQWETDEESGSSIGWESEGESEAHSRAKQRRLGEVLDRGA